MDDKELLIRQIALLEGMVERVKALEGKIESINNDKIQSLGTGLAVNQEKVRRIENIVYGVLMILIANLIGLVFLWIQKK